MIPALIDLPKGTSRDNPHDVGGLSIFPVKFHGEHPVAVVTLTEARGLQRRILELERDLESNRVILGKEVEHSHNLHERRHAALRELGALQDDVAAALLLLKSQRWEHVEQAVKLLERS